MGCVASKEEILVVEMTISSPVVESRQNSRARPPFPGQQRPRPRQRQTEKQEVQIIQLKEPDPPRRQERNHPGTLEDSMAKLDNVMQMLQDSSSFIDVYEEELDFGNEGRKISRKYSAYYEDIFDFYNFDEDESLESPDTYNTNTRSSLARDTLGRSNGTISTLKSNSTMRTSIIKQESRKICALCQEGLQAHEKASFILGRHWHKEHSECAECCRPIGHDNFAEINGLLYCSDHHINVNGMAVKKSKTERRDTLGRELKELENYHTVTKVRNFFREEREKRIQMLSIVDSAAEESGKRQRYVLSWMPPALQIEL